MVEKKVKSAIPIYLAAASWLIFSLLFPIYRITYVIFATILSILVYFLASILIPDRTIMVEEEIKPVNTGDGDVDVLIITGRQQLRRLHNFQGVLVDTEISAQVEELESCAAKILDFVEKDVRKARGIRSFLDYYLPTTIELVENYVNLKSQDVRGENIDRAIVKIESVMGTMVTAFKKQLDSLYEDKSMDIVHEVKAMQAILKREGLDGDSINISLEAMKDRSE